MTKDYTASRKTLQAYFDDARKYGVRYVVVLKKHTEINEVPCVIDKVEWLATHDDIIRLLRYDALRDAPQSRCLYLSRLFDTAADFKTQYAAATSPQVAIDALTPSARADYRRYLAEAKAKYPHAAPE